MPSNVYFDAGWNAAATPFVFRLTQTVGGVVTTNTITIDSGFFSHSGFECQGLAYTRFADVLESEILAAGFTGDFKVFFALDANGRYQYQLTNDTGVLSAGPAALDETFSFQLLGLDPLGQTGTALGLFGSRCPWHWIQTDKGGISNDSGTYESGDVARGAISDDGTYYSVARKSAPKERDFRIPFEPPELTFKCRAEDECPYTWEHFFEHVRGKHAFVVHEVDCCRRVHRLTPKGATFRAVRQVQNYDRYWTVRLRTYECACECPPSVPPEGAAN